MKLTNPNHPVWPLLRITVLMSSLTVILYVNASNFDFTEVRSLCEVFLIASGVEAAIRGYRAIVGKNES